VTEGDLWLSRAAAILIIAFDFYLIVWQVLGEQAVCGWVYEYQTLLAGSLAFVGAGIGAWFLNRQIGQADRHERHRIERKREAARAMLPLALSSILQYATESADAAKTLLDQCEDQALQPNPNLKVPAMPRLPTEALGALKEMIEFSTANETAVIAKIATVIQYQFSRLSSVISDAGSSPSGNIHIILAINLENYILDAAEIYARVELLFNFGRRRTDSIAGSVTWGQVRVAVSLMRFHEYKYPSIYETIDRRSGGASEAPLADN
jgi:hypothetical protein